MVGIPDAPKSRKRKARISISFAEEEDIINMEDVDPTVGKFRNMISTTIIPNKVSVSVLVHGRRHGHHQCTGGGWGQSGLRLVVGLTVREMGTFIRT